MGEGWEEFMNSFFYAPLLYLYLPIILSTGNGTRKTELPYHFTVSHFIRLNMVTKCAVVSISTGMVSVSDALCTLIGDGHYVKF